MQRHTHNINALVRSLSLALAVSAPIAAAHADPLAGEVLKFQQRPMAGTTLVNTTGTVIGTYDGHDSPSTAYWDPANNQYSGFFFADDFADLVSTPVVHVRWWGSYTQPVPHGNVQKFLIAFESDVPVGPNQPYSQPGSVLQSEIVTAGALSPASGTFTETLYQTVPGGEDIYQYNAELALPFNELKDTVYWLKIVALVDPALEGNLLWGWHNRDYTINDPFASVAPNVVPGEVDDRPLVDPNYYTQVWHFQDDAVRGGLTVAPNAAGTWAVNQFSMTPSSYLDGLDGPGLDLVQGGIAQFSQDLAFELYTIPVPEPASLGLLVLGSAAMLARRSRTA
jgi:hypothetical protein